MAQTQILGTSTITDRHRISLIKQVREAFENRGEGVEIGDQVVYRREGDKVVIEPA